MRIKVKKHCFSPLYWHIRDAMEDPNIRFVMLPGGSSASKSYSESQAFLLDTIENKNSHIVFRKVRADIRDAIFRDFKLIINSWKGIERFAKTKEDLRIECPGAMIRFRGLDDEGKVKGISGFKRVLLDELDQFEHSDFKQLRKRFRGMPGQQIHATWNPVDENHWIKKKVLDLEEWIDLPTEIPGKPESKLSDHAYKRINKKGNMLIIKTTYLDNYWVVGHPDGKHGFYDKHTIDDFEKDKEEDYEFYRVYALGEWGRLNKGGEFYKAFKEVRNMEVNGYDPELPLHLSFDENVHPYLALTIWQARDLKVWQVDEICLEDPKNTLAFTLTEFKKRYRDHDKGLFIYGDATSQKADTKLEKGHNFFTLIRKGLEDFNPSMRVPAANPSVFLRGIFINDVFAGRVPDVEVLLNPNKPKLLDDVRYVKEAEDGTKLKLKITDKQTKIRFEPYGHTSDTMDYFLTRYFRAQYRSFSRSTKTKKRAAMRPNTNIINF